MKGLKHIISIAIWTVFALYFGVIILTHIPSVQNEIGKRVSKGLSNKLATQVHIGRIDLGFLNRIIIDDVSIQDQKNLPMLHAARVSAKFNYLDLFKGNISISSAQLFGMKATLYKESSDSKTNFQFVIDSLGSKDKTTKKPLNLAINSIIIRNGLIAYDRHDIPNYSNQFNLNHIELSNISAHFIINVLTNDSLNLNVKKLSFKDKSGLDLRSLTFKMTANKRRMDLRDFQLSMPRSKLIIGNANATYNFYKGQLQKQSLKYGGSIFDSAITPCDLKCFESSLNNFVNTLQMSFSFSGTSSSVLVKELNVRSSNQSIYLNANGFLRNWHSKPQWKTTINNLTLKGSGIKFISKNLGQKFEIPSAITRLGDINYRGAIGGTGIKNANLTGTLRTDAGNVELIFEKNNNSFIGNITTSGFNLRRLLNNDHFGTIATHIDIEGNFIQKKSPTLFAKGVVTQFDYNSYRYENLYVNGTYNNQVFNGIIGMDDPNGKIDLKGTFSTNRNNLIAKISAQIKNFNPSELKISNQWPNTIFSLNLTADIKGSHLDTMDGNIDVEDFNMNSKGNTYHLNSLKLHSGKTNNNHILSIISDFGELQALGHFNYSTIAQSFINVIRSKFSFQSVSQDYPVLKNNLTINATINRSDWLQQIFNIPLELNQPLHLEGALNDYKQEMKMALLIPDFAYKGKHIKEGVLRISTPNDSVIFTANANVISTVGLKTNYHVQASAINNLLYTNLSFNNLDSERRFGGNLRVNTHFFEGKDRTPFFHSNILPSELLINDSVWTIHPSDIAYNKSHIEVNDFVIEHNKQHIIVNGMASKDYMDSLYVDLKDVDVNYIQDLLNFHPVDFSGALSGRAYLSGVFGKPEAWGKLTINNFLFEGGRMGTLVANVRLNNLNDQIDINAVAEDYPGTTHINGYVSPKHNYIDLKINAQQTRLEMVQGFCSSFMSHFSARGDGELRLSGPLNNINLTGMVVANGNTGISSLNTEYTMKNDTVLFVPDEIIFQRDTLYDAYNHIGILEGSLHHQHLTNLTYDLGINAQNLLAFNFNTFNDNPFYGTVFATGRCDIHGRNGETTIDVDATPERKSRFVYNASRPDEITSNTFVSWHNRDSLQLLNNSLWKEGTVIQSKGKKTKPNISSDLRMNFLIHSTQDLTLDLLMDKQSGDYITLNGNGVIRATYFDKGGFDMFGNYVVDHGVYKLSIQNAIKRDFQFAQGGTIAFGGNPNDAKLNLNAQYTVNGVSLSDLQLGHSFSNNNIPVNCIMNIIGTPKEPKVDFSLDLPTLGSDAKQMIYSLINSEEEMNQQVLYLLAIGRFYSQGTNNADLTTSQSNTSLAMQSLLSGTVSQQLNNLLNSISNNPNWNFGANISTGNEGWYNAEYEGLLNGRLLNNRLLINGQFGYRDKANATQSFIGDFDIRYLLTPNGNFSIKVYNQTNDRYFTRNSLTTQGLGLIVKKDFNGFKDLFNFPSKKEKLMRKQKNK